MKNIVTAPFLNSIIWIWWSWKNCLHENHIIVFQLNHPNIYRWTVIWSAHECYENMTIKVTEVLFIRNHNSMHIAHISTTFNQKVWLRIFSKLKLFDEKKNWFQMSVLFALHVCSLWVWNIYTKKNM